MLVNGVAIVIDETRVSSFIVDIEAEDIRDESSLSPPSRVVSS